MTVILRQKHSFKAPVNVQNISPDTFAAKTIEEIKKLEIWEGNKRRYLEELFDVNGENTKTVGEVKIQMTGDLRKVKRLGEGMTDGQITIEGDIGMHLGEKMKGGNITVSGNADSWLGAMMTGGTITVKGDAADCVGAAYRGSTKGMRGGTITIHGNAGNEVGCFMRNGLVKIYGNAGQFVGMRMHGGTILVQEDADERAGACMTDGKIVLLGKTGSILPSFTIDDIKKKVKINGEETQGPFYVFTGDITEKGNGKLYIAKTKNPHLSFYEKYL